MLSLIRSDGSVYLLVINKMQKEIRIQKSPVVTLKTGWREVPGLKPGRACRPSRSVVVVVVVFYTVRIFRNVTHGYQ